MLKFSIVIPAHNEAGYIEETLSHARDLNYPKDAYETIVVENGSSDETFALAKKFEGGNIKVLQSAKGVSRAKNLGIDNARPDADWVIFLDADTILKPEFLNELDAFLSKPNDHTVGTVSLSPLPDTRYARAWFFVHNVGHKLSKTSFAIKLVRRSLFPPVHFDVSLVTGEDIQVIKQALRHGTFFYMWTKTVATSTRRFEQLGWWYIMFYWTFVAALPDKWQRHFSYEAVR